jgi:hypothetical protein
MHFSLSSLTRGQQKPGSVKEAKKNKVFGALFKRLQVRWLDELLRRVVPEIRSSGNKKRPVQLSEKGRFVILS